MVAYSFKKMFILPIQVGLGLKPPDHVFEIEQPDGSFKFTTVRPKRQTIRQEGKRRHAKAGETTQLYHAMRTKQCFKIGEGRCTKTAAIYIEVERPLIRIGGWSNPERDIKRVKDLDEFAQQDGFEGWEQMAMFWFENHHADMNDFHGRIILWEPL